eukprot:834321-Rhodomonas_salina.1
MQLTSNHTLDAISGPRNEQRKEEHVSVGSGPRIGGDSVFVWRAVILSLWVKRVRREEGDCCDEDDMLVVLEAH